MYAEQLGHSSFSGSNGCLDHWMKRHYVRLACLSGEAAVVNPLLWMIGAKDCCQFLSGMT